MAKSSDLHHCDHSKSYHTESCDKELNKVSYDYSVETGECRIDQRYQHAYPDGPPLGNIRHNRNDAAHGERYPTNSEQVLYDAGEKRSESAQECRRLALIA